MKLSTRCRYGLRAVLAIALQYGKSPVKRKNIAKQERLSSSYLENILLVLRNHKIVETERGVNGGYVLCRPPSSITAFDIVNALDGPLSLVECVDKPKGCEKAGDCATRFVWCSLATSVKKTLDAITLQEIIDRSRVGKSADYSI